MVEEQSDAMMGKTTRVLIVAGVLLTAIPSAAQERHRMMRPIVPPDQLETARALKSPLPDSLEIVEKGKAIYEGKGTCFNCHGLSGRGDGAGGASLDPSPRNFRHRGMWRHRTEGEIFWVIKNGSPGTGMIAFGGMLTDEEIWTVMQYERMFGERGHGRGRGPREGMGPRGPRGGRGTHGDMEGMPHRGGMRSMGQKEGECCEE